MFLPHAFSSRILFPLLTVLLLLAGAATAAEGKAGSSAGAEKAIQQAWDITWGRFFSPKTQLFYDYLSSYEAGQELAHLPTAEEVAKQFPNPCGYSTGMEDCMILGGAMLSVLSDRYDVTHEPALKASIDQVFKGVKLCMTVHGVEGFVARGVSPKDGKNVYINSSRDQYTHCVHGLWQYYRSGLSDDSRKAEIRSLLRAVAERMIKYVTPENNYDFLRLDGKPCALGICKMWEVQAHEAARLPMIYAAAWDATGDERYLKLYRQYVVPAVEQSATPGENKPAYALLQMQCSLEVLYELEKDPALKSRLRERMQHVAEISMKRTEAVQKDLARMSPDQKAMLGPDWRKVSLWRNQKGYMNPQWGDYRKVWHALREAGESALVPMMVPGFEIPQAQQERLVAIVAGSDYAHMSSCGIVYHLASWWKARKLGLL